MNKKVNLLIDKPCPELLCGICSDVLEDPIQVHCPEDHMFCNKCIQQHVEDHSHCPMCLTQLDKNTFQLSKFVQRQISRLRIKCLFADDGCPWTGFLSDEHIANCEYKPSLCPNAEKGCDIKNLNSANMQEHLRTCLYQIMTCPNNMPLCEPFLLKDISKHENECQSYTCPYASEGCPFIGTLSQAKSHCDLYCGQLHKKVTDLEEEVKRLNKLLISLGLDIKLPSTPDTNKHEDDKPSQDTPMEGLDLFHQMFNDDTFAAMNLASTPNDILAGPSALNDKSMMDLSTCLPDIDFLNPTTKDEKSDKKQIEPFDFDSLFESATSPPQSLQFMMPLSAPKRTSNGKKIRYSKNKLLAHNALRIARQRTASNPSNDAILNNLDIAKQKKTQVVFKNLDDVTKFLDTDSATNSSSLSPSSSSTSSIVTPKLSTATVKKEKKKSVSSASSPPQLTDSASSPVSSTTPKRRPMFILASSYLSNYNNSNDRV